MAVRGLLVGISVGGGVAVMDAPGVALFSVGVASAKVGKMSAADPGEQAVSGCNNRTLRKHDPHRIRIRSLKHKNVSYHCFKRAKFNLPRVVWFRKLFWLFAR